MNNSLFSTQIAIQGIVQGVGFRPFVYRLALRHRLSGYVANTAAGLVIEAIGSQAVLDLFLAALTAEKPTAASIASISQHTTPTICPITLPPFEIRTSHHTGTRTLLVAPDLATCDECLAELDDPTDRRHGYPFINCTNCGPRYTLIEDLPYDRPRTSMKIFPLCAACEREYLDPGNRRFHAQPNACPVCGPQLQLHDQWGQPVMGEPLAQTIALLKAGQIVAIKSLGGFHLAADGENENAVARLRQGKGRPAKPLAVMAADLDAVAAFAQSDETEKKWLSALHRPIVLLRQQPLFPLAPNLAPGIQSIGTMLPYTPLHHLLFKDRKFKALVMTSANLAGAPIVKDNQAALAQLASLADYFLLHNREIVTSNDDSIIQIQGDQPLFLRRSRSFAPAPLRLHRALPPTLAVGGTQKNTICLAQGKNYFLSQHIGDLEHLETITHFETVISHLRQLLQIEPSLIVHDLHPDYPSTRYALAQGISTIAVQHHHAHAASCMAEHNLTGPVLAITLDGSGLGPDGTIWGGEILIADYPGYTRVAHLLPLPLPGGESAIREPWRVALSYLHQTFGPTFTTLPLKIVERHRQTLPTIVGMIENKVNSPLTSSCGRLFDGIAALLGVREFSSFEGQAAMELEVLANPNEYGHYPLIFTPSPENSWPLSTSAIIEAVVSDLRRKTPIDRIAARFHHTLAHLFAQVCRQLRDAHHLERVVLSGGVFQNQLLAELLAQLLTKSGFAVYRHRQVPPNDGGLALGQAVAGRAILDQREEQRCRSIARLNEKKKYGGPICPLP